jgi:hypothetical protein
MLPATMPLPPDAFLLYMHVLLSHYCCQVNTVGKAETAYLPGVLVPEVIVGGAADEAGFKPGDTILRVGNYTVAASSEQVGRGSGWVVCVQYQVSGLPSCCVVSAVSMATWNTHQTCSSLVCSSPAPPPSLPAPSPVQALFAQTR